jgi:hypothetical protein
MAARVFKVEFRIAVAQRILNGETVSSLSSQYKIRRSVLYRWRDAYHEKGKAGFGQPRGPRPGAKRNAMAEPFRGSLFGAFSGTDGVTPNASYGGYSVWSGNSPETPLMYCSPE